MVGRSDKVLAFKNKQNSNKPGRGIEIMIGTTKDKNFS